MSKTEHRFARFPKVFQNSCWSYSDAAAAAAGKVSGAPLVFTSTPAVVAAVAVAGAGAAEIWLRFWYGMLDLHIRLERELYNQSWNSHCFAEVGFASLHPLPPVQPGNDN